MLRPLRRRACGARGVPPLREPARCGCPDGLRWNLLHLFAEAVGLPARRASSTASASTPGASTTRCWTSTAACSACPFHYRDERTEGMSARRRRSGYAVTGIQDMPINTVYQLLAETRLGGAARGALDRARARPARLLAERRAGQRDHQRVDHRPARRAHRRVGARADRAARAAGAAVRRAGRAGHARSARRSSTTRSTRPSTPSPATTPPRRTSAAPLRDEHSAILSSGTWSLLGLELPSAGASRDRALTNERGVDGTIRLLKNVMGLWLEQECARVWDAGFAELHARRARRSPRAACRCSTPTTSASCAAATCPR